MIVIACITVCKLILACNVCKVESTVEHELIPTSSSCSTGTYYSQDYRMCLPCSTCDVYSTMFTTCTATSDTVCIKCADTSSKQDLDNHPACKQCPPCKAGEYLETRCTNSSPTVCRPCPVGSFSKLSSYQTYCFPCTSCLNKIMIKDCNASLDTECGVCKKGYFKDQGRNRCYPCVSCMNGQPIVEECKNGRPGKLCSAYSFSRVDYISIPLIEDTVTSSSLMMLNSTINISTLVSSEDVSTESNSLFLSKLDVTIILTVLLIIFILSLMIILLRRRLKTQLKRRGLIDNDDNENTILYLDNVGHEDDLADCQSLTERRLSNDLSDKNTSMDPGYIGNPIEHTSNIDGSGSGRYSSGSFLNSFQSEDNVKKDQRKLFQNLPTHCENLIYPHEYRKDSRKA